MTLKLSPVPKNELSSVLKLFKEAASSIKNKGVDHWQYWHKPPKQKIEWVKDGLEKKEFYYVMNDLNNLIGMVRVLNEDLPYWGIQHEKSKYIHSLVVKPEFNGNGIGKSIIDQIAEKAKIENCIYLRLDAVKSNIKLCNYYENIGFTRVKEGNFFGNIHNLYQLKLSY